MNTSSEPIGQSTNLAKRNFSQAFVDRNDVKLKLSHRNFKQLKKLINRNDPDLFEAAGMAKLVFVDEN